VICEDRALLYEEAPRACKDVDRVVADLVDAGAVAAVATLWPLRTCKDAHARPLNPGPCDALLARALRRRLSALNSESIAP
jgi:hypothetical protein